MSDLLLSLVADYGAIMLFATTFLSCLAIPMPSSLMMLAGGGFVASGDLGLTSAVSAAYLGAVAGDQTGFQIGRKAGAWLARTPKRKALLSKANSLTTRYGGPGVFLSRWLFSPLGPYVNFGGGATGYNWAGFTLWGALGEAVWVTLYVSLGYLFADRITEVADILGNASGFLAALVVTIGLGFWLRHAMKHPRKS
ncbi:DedA family protein [Profundibacter sp.]